MKVFVKLFQLMAVIGLLFACSETSDFYGGEAPEPLDELSKNNSHRGLDQDRFVTMKSTGLRVHYRIIGKGPIDVVFIPGWTNPLEVFQKQFDYFRNKARCIYLDVPGQGLSDAPEGVDYTMELMADAIYDVIKKEGVHNFVAVGFSMGTRPLGQFELKYPGMITKLINLDASFTKWPPVGDPARDTYIANREGFIAWMETWGVDEWNLMLPSLVPDTAPQDLKDFVTYVYSFPSWLSANIYRNLTNENVNQPIGWSFPILSIYSTLPADMDFEQLCFPDADIHEMVGSGHVVQWERADIVNALIYEFISDRPGNKY